MRQLPAEPQVYETLKEHVRTPGRYTVNPQLTAEGRFPDDQPVFSVLYGGVGHEAAGSLMLLGLVLFLLTPMIGAWMLTQTSTRAKSSGGTWRTRIGRRARASRSRGCTRMVEMSWNWITYSGACRSPSILGTFSRSCSGWTDHWTDHQNRNVRVTCGPHPVNP